MTRSIRIALVMIGGAVLAQQAVAQESKAAKYTREKLLKQVIDEFDSKETATKVFFEDVNRELETTIRFQIDGYSGVSNNTKLSYKGKKITVEKLLNDISDKFEFGWVVISDPGNNKRDGAVVIRKNSKGKERGYELGREPKVERSSTLELPRREVGFVLQELKVGTTPAVRDAVASTPAP